MSDELISKDNILKTIREWTNEYIPQTLYGDGYDDAVKDIIKLIETEIPVNAVELPCKIGDTVFILARDLDGFMIIEQPIEQITIIDGGSVSQIKIKGGLWEYSDFGKDIWFTREEAEAALREMEENQQ